MLRHRRRSSARRALAIVGVLVVACGSAGCGRSGDQAAVQTVMTQFFSALESDDGQAACADLSAGTRSALEDQEKQACRDAITQLDIQSARVVSSQVYGQDAMVELASGDAAFLNQESGGWRVSAAGCTPVGDKPYDCELED